jgi:hypothetical protein
VPPHRWLSIRSTAPRLAGAPIESLGVARIQLTDARGNLGVIIKRIFAGGGCSILEEDGLPVAALVDLDQFED